MECVDEFSELIFWLNSKMIKECMMIHVIFLYDNENN